MNKKLENVFLLMLLLCSVSMISLYGVETASGINRNDLRLMSFNIRNSYAKDGDNHWDLRKEQVYGVIKSYRPDILGLQEVNHLQLTQLRKQMQEYEDVGIGSQGGTKGQYSSIFYLKKKFKLVDSGNFWLSETPEKPSKSWSSAHVRICTWVRLIELESSKEVLVYNTHMDDGSKKAREKGAELIRQHLNNQMIKNRFIIMGDFNAAEDSDALQQLKGSGASKAVDSFRVLNPDAEDVGTYNGFKDKVGGKKIDYILVPENSLVLEVSILMSNKNGKYPSDHYPVTARVHFRESQTVPQSGKKDLRDVNPTYANISYGGFERNKLDFWQAKGKGPHPLLVNIHGGGWIQGDKTRLKTIKKYLDRGISVAAVNYRLTGNDPLPAPVFDAARAIQFLRYYSKQFNIDTDNIVLSGDSAGGCTSMWLACHDDLAETDSKDPIKRESTRVQGIAVAGAQSAIDPMLIEPWIGPKVHHGMIISAVGEKNIENVLKNYDQHQKIFHEFSPINHLSKDDPPMFMAYMGDMTLPATSPGHAIHHGIFGVKMKEKSTKKGHDKVYLQIGTNRDSNFKNLDDFIFKTLLKKAK